jgi:hypothetical protein
MNIVYIFDLNVIGHVDVVDDPRRVHYVLDGHRYIVVMDESQYVVVDTIEIEIEEYE